MFHKILKKPILILHMDFYRWNHSQVLISYSEGEVYVLSGLRF
jgi:hypothetical protein